MKVRIIKTGEVVEIISYSSLTTRNETLDNVSYIDSQGKALGEKEWRGCGAMKNAITHWQPIVLPKKE